MENPESKSRLTPGYRDRRLSDMHNLRPRDLSGAIYNAMKESEERAIDNKAQSGEATPDTPPLFEAPAAPTPIRPRFRVVSPVSENNPHIEKRASNE